MDHEDLTRQTLVEQELLGYVVAGLRTTAGWEVHGPDGSRKLATLRFIAESFQRHLEHLMALEEYDGYMDLVRLTTPRLAKAVDALQRQHEHFRGWTRQFVVELERLAPTDLDGLAEVCAELLGLLREVDEHNQKEVKLLQEAFDRDGGGEG